MEGCSNNLHNLNKITKSARSDSLRSPRPEAPEYPEYPGGSSYPSRASLNSSFSISPRTAPFSPHSAQESHSTASNPGAPRVQPGISRCIARRPHHTTHVPPPPPCQRTRRKTWASLLTTTRVSAGERGGRVLAGAGRRVARVSGKSADESARIRLEHTFVETPCTPLVLEPPPPSRVLEPS